MNNQVIEKTKKHRERSPSYPVINLESAIEKAKIIKEKESGGKHYIPIRAALEHWGYSINSGYGLRILSALQKYKLIDIMGSGSSRQVKLSDLAQKVLFYGVDTESYRESIVEAALSPMIYNELWEKYDNTIPSDTALTTYLVLERKPQFSENAAKDLIEQFKSTFSFTKLANHNSISGCSEDKKLQNKEKQMETIPNIQENSQPPFIPQIGESTKKTINFPVKISEKMMANLQIQYPMEEKDLLDFLTALEALKPGILQSVLNKQNEYDKRN